MSKETKVKRIKLNRKIMLVLLDIMSVLIASFGALYVRFEFRISAIPSRYPDRYITIVIPVAIITIIIFYFMKMYKSVWRFASATELVNITLGTTASAVVQIILGLILGKVNNLYESFMPKSYYALYWIFLFGCVCVIRFGYRFLRIFKSKNKQSAKGEVYNCMVIGAGEAGNAIIKEIEGSRYLNMSVKCIIDDNKGCHGKILRGVPITGDRTTIPDAVKQYGIDEIIFAIPSANVQTRKEILEICKETGCKLRAVPGTYQLINGDVSVAELKEVDIEDLLGREPVKINIEDIMGYVSGKVIMVTGGGGSIGSELCRQIASHNPGQLIIVDIYENNAYDIEQELKQKYPELNLVTLIASVRNTKRINDIFEKYHPEIVYHAAAHKHVPLMETSPNEAVKNNVLGTWKVVQAADKYKVKRFVMISTDKAVNPTNIMGATKRICEMIVQTYNNHSETEFVAVRFGNVLGSNGSVIPLFKKQIANGGPVTVTDPEIIRYFMTIPEAVSLVLQAGAYAKGGEIFVLDMGEPVKILTLAENLIKLSGYRVGEDIDIVFTGLRPGEKMYEEMLMMEEGMKETPNKLIHIGKPLEIDESKFMSQLENLKAYVEAEPDDIRNKVAEIVSTYKITQ